MSVSVSVSESESESESESVSESESESESEIEFESEFEKGDKVKCNWYEDGDEDQWYFCEVLSVDIINRTAHVKAEDGDEKLKMSWDWMRNLKYYQ